MLKGPATALLEYFDAEAFQVSVQFSDLLGRLIQFQNLNGAYGCGVRLVGEWII